MSTEHQHIYRLKTQTEQYTNTTVKDKDGLGLIHHQACQTIIKAWALAVRPADGQDMKGRAQSQSNIIENKLLH